MCMYYCTYYTVVFLWKNNELTLGGAQGSGIEGSSETRTRETNSRRGRARRQTFHSRRGRKSE